MPEIDSTHWALSYPPARPTRVLFSVHPGMHRDLRVLAKSRGIPFSELLRQLITREVAEFLEQRPDLQASFKGQLIAHAPQALQEEPGS